MAICAICGATLEESRVLVLGCPDQARHPLGEPKIGSAVLSCPQKKGAIWVHVVDERGEAIRFIEVTVAKAPVPGPKPTDRTGFSSFDPLEEGDDYVVEIEIPELHLDNFYPAKRMRVEKVPVRSGQITSVEFTLERVAPLRVTVVHPDEFLGEWDIAVAGASVDFNPASAATKWRGYLLYPKLRKSDYTVKFTLTGEQKKRFTIEGADSKSWSHNPFQRNEVIFTVVPLKLLTLVATNAKALVLNRYWCVADAVKTVRVKATTDPDDKTTWAQLTWSGATPTGDNNEALVNITNTGDLVVEASLNIEKSVTIEVYDLVKVDCPLLKKLSASKWKAYKSDKVAQLKATTKPDEERVWKHLTWSEGAPTPTNNECAVDLKPVGDRTVTVSLDGKPLPAELHICQWPLLEIKEVTFECHEVLNDGVAGIGKPFDKKWKVGRADPAPNVAAAITQSPICFTRLKKIKLSAVFKVTEPATEDEKVKVKGNLGFGDVEAEITVLAGAVEATMPMTESTAALPKEVGVSDAWDIDWVSILEDGVTWADAKSSTHWLYVLLGDPQALVYFTLLDISCEGGDGLDNENDFVAASFVPFTLHTGDGNGFERKGDGLKMSYYMQGVDTAADDTTYTTKGILSGPFATGRCGGWAELLKHMWLIHGVASTSVWFVRALDPDRTDMDKRFLVKNVDFSAPGSLVGLYTHDVADLGKPNGAAGQGKTNPQFDFGDHVVNKHGGKIFDPSYGMGPFLDNKTYLSAALDGLGSHTTGKQLFTMADATEQHIPAECVPYDQGFAEYTIRPGTLADIAADYGISATALLDLDPILKALRLIPDQVVPGDTISIPMLVGPNQLRTVKVGITLGVIAAAHGVTGQAIFDHPSNSALKVQRTLIGNLIAGDKVIVSWELIADGVWVNGHDQ